MLDGSPNVIMMVQARDRQRLAKLTVAALASVENMTEGLQLQPTRDERDMSVFTKPSCSGGNKQNVPKRKNRIEINFSGAETNEDIALP